MVNVNNPIIIALVGKGGVGKTSISALMIRILMEKYPDKRILAIDADPAVGLATALGVSVSSTVDDIRNLFVSTVEDGKTDSAIKMLSEAKYRMVDSIVEINNLSFLAIGRPEASGCYCKVNAYLKEVISMIASNYDFIVIDGEAGIEQINRRVMDSVSHLVLVSDGSRKGLEVVRTIYDVSKRLVNFKHYGLIVNRVIDLSYVDSIDTLGLNVLTFIPDDRKMTKSDMMGDSIFELDSNSIIYQKTKIALKKLLEGE